MKIGKLKKGKQYESRNDRLLQVQTYGDHNDFPQQVMQIVETSVSGKPCVDVYSNEDMRTLAEKSALVVFCL
jgi:hypothetical protein